MKHIQSFFLAAIFSLLFMQEAFPQNIPAKSKITVALPVLQNAEEKDAWIPLFVQGQLTTDFQNYSSWTVIDRQAAGQILGEQAIIEQKAFMNNESVAIEYAANVNADFLVAAHILKTPNGFSLSCSVQDVKNSSAVGKSYSAAQVSEAALSDGSALHAASYELLKGLGVAENTLRPLKENGTSRSADVSANYYTAKGIAAESSGNNIVEALAYYQKAVGSHSALTEGTERLNSLTASLSTSSLREQALNKIALHKKWKKIWTDLNDYIEKNCAYIAYSPDSLEIGEINFEKETADISLPVGWRLDPICHDLYQRIYGAYMTAASGKKWGGIDGYNGKHWNGLGEYRYTIYFSLYDDKEKLLGQASQTVLRTMDYVNGMAVSMLTLKNVNPNAITDKLRIEITTDTAGGTVYTLARMSAE